MSPQQINIRHSPFLFLKRLVAIQFFFALLPFLAALLLSLFLGDFSAAYDRLAIARSISFEFFLTLLSTVLQLGILFLAFVTWFGSTYVADRQRIVHKRANLLGETVLVNTPAITNILLRQGWLARRVGYGTLQIETSDAAGSADLKDVSDPQRQLELIWDLVQPQTAESNPLYGTTPGELVRAGENQYVEFKSSLLWDYRQQRINKDLYVPVLKNVAAFMNTGGGYVVIGVDDDGRVLGLEADLQAMRRGTTDGFESTFNNAFNQMIGVDYREFVDLAFPTLEDMLICVLGVRPSDRPIFLVQKGEESFYIRAGNASQPLSVSQAARYISRRFDT